MTFNMLKRTAGIPALLLAVTVLAGATMDAQAQGLRVGYTDHEIIIVNMPEYQDIQQQMQQEFQGGQAELQEMYQEYQTKLERYQKQQALLSEEVRQQREQELTQLQQSIQQEAQAKEQQMAQREQELMQPLLERVQQAIDTVAERQNLDIVLRAQVGTQPLLLYVNPETIADITLDVARELGLDVDEAAAAAATGN